MSAPGPSLVLAASLSACLALAAACGGDSPGGRDDARAPGDAAIADAASGSPDDASAGADGSAPPIRECSVAECEGAIGRTCEDEPQVVDCGRFGASCGDFEDTESGEPFGWCDCGDLESLEGFCLGGRTGILCFDGLGGLADCGPGMRCEDDPDSPSISCECTNADDGVCPDSSCTDDPDCATCTPDCDGLECGDNGCGGTCGSCDFGEECSEDGQCEIVCVPECDGKQCGPDGCGGACGTCDGTCTDDGTCEGECVPDCDDRQCGPDGCGGTCGSCDPDLECNESGQCDCPFFDTVDYVLRLDPDADWSELFGVTLNVKHINVDGSETSPDGELLCDREGCDTTTFEKTVFGCAAHIYIKREYSYLGGSPTCTYEDVVEDETDIVIPAPTRDGDGGCTAPSL